MMQTKRRRRARRLAIDGKATARSAKGNLRWHVDWWYNGAQKYFQFDPGSNTEQDVIAALDGAGIGHGKPEDARYHAGNRVFYPRYLSIYGFWPDIDASRASVRRALQGFAQSEVETPSTPFAIDRAIPALLVERFTYEIENNNWNFVRGFLDRLAAHQGRIDWLRLTVNEGRMAYMEDTDIYPQGMCESRAILGFIESAARMSTGASTTVVVLSIKFPTGASLEEFAAAVPGHVVPLSAANVRQ